MRVAAAALDEAAEYLGGRVGTYDEQDGEADAYRRVVDASRELKLRLASDVLHGLAHMVGERLQRGKH